MPIKAKNKKANQTSFDDLADELMNKVKPNLTHGDNSETLTQKENSENFESIGTKLNKEWRRL